MKKEEKKDETNEVVEEVTASKEVKTTKEETKSWVGNHSVGNNK